MLDGGRLGSLSLVLISVQRVMAVPAVMLKLLLAECCLSSRRFAVVRTSFPASETNGTERTVEETKRSSTVIFWT